MARQSHVKGIPYIKWYYKGERLPNGEIVIVTRVGWDSASARKLTVRQVQTIQHGGATYEQRKKLAGKVSLKKELAPKKAPSKRIGAKQKELALKKRTSILSYLPGFHRNKDGSYSDNYGNTISKYQATKIVKGKITIAEAAGGYTKEKVEEHLEATGWSAYRFSDFEKAKQFAKTNGKKRKMFIKVAGRAWMRYEDESVKGIHWRALSTTAWQTYTKDAYWEFVKEQIDTMFIGGEYRYLVLYFKEVQK